MEFRITGVVDDQITTHGTSRNSKGGTEMMLDGLLSRLTDEQKNKFNFICSRVRDVPSDKKNILWLHDLWEDPEARHLNDPASRSRFSKLVFVSYHQFEGYRLAYGLKYSEAAIIRNAIVPFNRVEKSSEGPLRLIYHTTPHRGLELLVPAFEALYQNFGDRIHLDVYSSFSIYGWPHRDEQYQHVFNRCREHPGITYHGAVSNEEVREALNRAHIFAYPSIWPETSCIAAIEAMAAGCSIVCSNLGALPETTANFATMYAYHEDPIVHANRFANQLAAVIENYWSDGHVSLLEYQRVIFNSFYSWDRRIDEWNDLLSNMET